MLDDGRLVLLRLLLDFGVSDLSAEELLHFEDGFVLIDAELLQQAVVILFEDALQHFVFSHVVIVCGILRFLVTDLGQVARLNFRLKLAKLLGYVAVLDRLMNSDDPLGSLVESNKFVSKSKPCSASRLDPLRHVRGLSFLLNLRLGVGSSGV